MLFVHASQPREERARGWQGLQDLREARVEMDDLSDTCLGAKEAHNPAGPVDVLGLQTGNVALGATEVPAAPEERFSSGFGSRRTIFRCSSSVMARFGL